MTCSSQVGRPGVYHAAGDDGVLWILHVDAPAILVAEDVLVDEAARTVTFWPDAAHRETHPIGRLEKQPPLPGARRTDR